MCCCPSVIIKQLPLPCSKVSWLRWWMVCSLSLQKAGWLPNSHQCFLSTTAVLCLCPGPGPGPRPCAPSMCPGLSMSEDSPSSAPQLQHVHRRVPPSVFPSVTDKSRLNGMQGPFWLRYSKLWNSCLPREISKALLHAMSIYWSHPIGRLCGTQMCPPPLELGGCQGKAFLWPLLHPDLSWRLPG